MSTTFSAASTCNAQLECNGFYLQSNLLDESAVAHLCDALEAPTSTCATAHKRDFARRDVLQVLAVRQQCESGAIGRFMRGLLGDAARPVRGLLFDKNADANWKVPWHQDLTIAVKEKRETRGFSAWTRKVGIFHVQPPVEILEKMLTLRFHLDNADEMNGALKVIPKSHKYGRLNSEEIINRRQANETTVCGVKKGDCLLMRPLLLHSSSAGSNPKNRRVIHFEFSAEDLPNGLNWYDS